jgi:hypothetical protein
LFNLICQKNTLIMLSILFCFLFFDIIIVMLFFGVLNKVFYNFINKDVKRLKISYIVTWNNQSNCI